MKSITDVAADAIEQEGFYITDFRDGALIFNPKEGLLELFGSTGNDKHTEIHFPKYSLTFGDDFERLALFFREMFGVGRVMLLANQQMGYTKIFEGCDSL